MVAFGSNVPVTFHARTRREKVVDHGAGWCAPLPRTAFHGQTPDEMYFGTGADIPNNGRLRKWRLNLTPNRRTIFQCHVRAGRVVILEVRPQDAQQVSKWRSMLTIIEPATVIHGHGQKFKLFRGRKSRGGKIGRPRVERDVRELIRRMSLENTIWRSAAH